jgi:hypothetical protein
MNLRLLAFLGCCICGVPLLAQQAETAPVANSSVKTSGAAVKRIGDDIRYLASDELEGRGPQTKGLELAAKHMEEVFVEAGLVGGGDDGTYRNPFEISVDTKVDEKDTKLIFKTQDGIIELEAGKDFQALAAGGNGKANAELVFVGYGINAPNLNYSDYEGIDVEGKIVVVIRREPQQDDEESVFDGKRTSQHSFIRTKLDAVKKAKAAAIVMVNDPHSTHEKQDVLSRPAGFGSRGAGIPFFHMTKQRLNDLLSQHPVKVGDKELKTVKEISDQIDSDLQPLSQTLGITAEVGCKVEEVNASVSNVIGILEAEGPLAEETIVVGAHYDHLGMGPFGSRRPEERAVHNGADDNATGTAAVMELARRLSATKLKRRIVFIGFTAEERGILGSNHYLANPAIALDKTVAMINFDMIGMYGKQGITLGGANTAKEFPELLARATEGADFNVKQSQSVGGSDHAGFYNKDIPIMFFHTGLTDLYHTPDDDFETIDVEGAATTIDLAERVIREIAELPERPTFTKVAPRRRRGMVYLGVTLDFENAGEGVGIEDVAPNSPASKAGVQPGDVIVKIGDDDVSSLQDLPGILRQRKPGDEVDVIVKRADKEVTLKVKLTGPPRNR